MIFWSKFCLLALLLTCNSAQAVNVRYQHTDMLGSVVSESDASGNIISRSHYEPFGKRIGGDKEGIGYTGHLLDKDLGLTYMQARYYDPLIGRFYSNDPVGFTASNPMSFNRYLYVNNNPYKYTDPDGEWLQVVYGAIAGAVGGYVASNEGFANTAIGMVSGAVAGAITGVAFPQASHAAGLAAAGMASSFTGQALSSTISAGLDKGFENLSYSDVKIDAVTTISAGLGAGAGGLVAKGIAGMTEKSIIGESFKTISQLGGPTNTGVAAGAVVEGAITGTAEKIAPVVKEAFEGVLR